jgi:hypothetical protein
MIIEAAICKLSLAKNAQNAALPHLARSSRADFQPR